MKSILHSRAHVEDRGLGRADEGDRRGGGDLVDRLCLGRRRQVHEAPLPRSRVLALGGR